MFWQVLVGGKACQWQAHPRHQQPHPTLFVGRPSNPWERLSVGTRWASNQHVRVCCTTAVVSQGHEGKGHGTITRTPEGKTERISTLNSATLSCTRVGCGDAPSHADGRDRRTRALCSSCLGSEVAHSVARIDPAVHPLVLGGHGAVLGLSGDTVPARARGGMGWAR